MTPLLTSYVTWYIITVSSSVNPGVRNRTFVLFQGVAGSALSVMSILGQGAPLSAFCRVLCVLGTLSSALGKGLCSFSDHTSALAGDRVYYTWPFSHWFIFWFCLSGGGIYFFCQAWLLVWISAEFQGQSISPGILERLSPCFLTV